MRAVYVVAVAAIMMATPTAGAAEMDQPIVGDWGGLRQLRHPVEASGASYHADATSIHRIAIAQAKPVSGRIEGRFNYSTLDDEAFGNEIDGTSWTLRGSVNLSAAAFNLQVDGSAKHVSREGLEGSSLGGTAHAYYRPVGGRYAAGVFASTTRLRDGTGTLASLGMGSEATDVIGGAEIAALTRAATFYARAGAGGASHEGFDADRLHLAIGSRFFVGTSLRFDLEGTVDRTSTALGDADLYSFKAVANYRPEGRNYSLFGGVRRDHARVETAAGFGQGVSMNSYFAGARLHFGDHGFRAQDRGGALWEAIDPLP